MSDMPSFANPTPSPFNRGPMTSVDGDYAPPAPGTPQGIPSSFGGNVDLASAFEGTLSDMRAVAQQTLKTLSDIGIMAQRVTSMLGGTAGGSMAASPIPNQVPQLFGSHSSSSNIAAAISQASGASYGSAANATPQWNPSFGTMPTDMTNPAFASIPTNFGMGPTAQPVPNFVPSSPADAPSPSSGPSWGPASNDESKRDADIEKIKHFAEAALGGEFFENHGGEQAGVAKSLAQHPSVRGITQTLAQNLLKARPNMGEKVKLRPWDSVSNTDPVKASYLRAAGTTAGDDAIETATARGIPTAVRGLSAGVGALAEGGGITEAAGAALGGSAMAGIGLVAAPIAAVGLGLHEMESQRAENAQIQSQIGGSNFAAFGTRAQGLGFGLSEMGTMSMGMANQAFMGVTDMGLQGGKRSNALDFITKNYTSMGMSIADSLSLVSASVKSGTANLQQLAGVLDSVSTTAATAGINTESARQGFASMFAGAVSGSGGNMNATNAAVFAGAQQNIISGLGQPGVGLTATSAPSALIAGIAGKSLGASEYMQMGSSGAAYTASMQQKMQSQITGEINRGTGAKTNMKPGQFNKQFLDNGGSIQEIQGLLQSPAFGYSATQINSMAPGALLNLWQKVSKPNNLANAVSVSQSQTSMSNYANRLSAIAGQGSESMDNVGQDQSAAGELSATQRWISGHKATPAEAARLSALMVHGGKGKVTVNGQSMSVWDAMQNQGDLTKIAQGKGSYTGVHGGSENLSKFFTQHVTNKTPPSSTKNKGKGAGTVTISLTPAAAQLVQIATSGAAQIGNNYGTINTPPTGIPAFSPG